LRLRFERSRSVLLLKIRGVPAGSTLTATGPERRAGAALVPRGEVAGKSSAASPCSCATSPAQKTTQKEEQRTNGVHALRKARYPRDRAARRTAASLKGSCNHKRRRFSLPRCAAFDSAGGARSQLFAVQRQKRRKRPRNAQPASAAAESEC